MFIEIGGSYISIGNWGKIGNLTDETSEMTEQTKINISSFLFVTLRIVISEMEENTYV